MIELLLLKELVEIVIDYFDDGSYPITVSTHNWAFENITEIAVDSARLYVLTRSQGLKGLDHSLANVKENERRLIEFGDAKWSSYYYDHFNNSHDGRYVSFSDSHKVLTDQEKQTNRSTKWLMQSNEPDDRRPKRVTFDGEDLDGGVLSRDGQTLCVCSDDMNPITRVYRLREEAGKDPVALMKFKLDGKVHAVSGNANRVLISKSRRLEIHDISKDASKLVCQFDVAGFAYDCALNGDGSETAFYDDGGLRILEVDKANGSTMDQSAIVTVKVLESLGHIDKLVYSDGGKLHVLHYGGKISLFDPSTKELILLEAPQEGQEVFGWAISPNADYIAFQLSAGKKEENGKDIRIYRTIVKRKCKDSDWKDLFGCEIDKNKQATKP